MLVRDVKWLGYPKVGLRLGNEPAILKLLAHALSELRIAVQGREQVFEEHPNSYDSSGNGEIEVAVKHVTGVIASNKLELERRVGWSSPNHIRSSAGWSAIRLGC